MQDDMVFAMEYNANYELNVAYEFNTRARPGLFCESYRGFAS